MIYVHMRCFLVLFVVYSFSRTVQTAWSPGSFRSAEADHVSAALLNVMLLQAPSLLGQAYHLDPSDYFTGALHRPRLEIIHPENGQVLDNGNLAIEIKLDGYDLPSHFHDSRVCVGLSSGSWVAEQCFDQSLDLVFHVNGLTAGLQYALRIVFYERGNAIAVSVRNFRVGGIKGLLNSNPEEAVSILTAVQVGDCDSSLSVELLVPTSLYTSLTYLFLLPRIANTPLSYIHLILILSHTVRRWSFPTYRVALFVPTAYLLTHSHISPSNSLTHCAQVAVHYQASGMETQAEHIYRSILSEYPAYPDALHLLGNQQ